MATESDRLEVSDGTDTAVLTASRNGWRVDLRVEDDDDVRRQRLLEAATQAVMIDGGGRLEYWVEDADASSNRVPLAAGFTPWRDLWCLSLIHKRTGEPWFDADGFRLLEDEASGRLAGFCWTKVHDDRKPPAGEIYAIAVDPDFHGQGLGRPLVLAGLAWLAGRGLRHAMLYVESDNMHANRIYEELGFRRAATNRAFQRIVR